MLVFSLLEIALVVYHDNEYQPPLQESFMRHSNLVGISTSHLGTSIHYDIPFGDRALLRYLDSRARRMMLRPVRLATKLEHEPQLAQLLGKTSPVLTTARKVVLSSLTTISNNTLHLEVDVWWGQDTITRLTFDVHVSPDDWDYLTVMRRFVFKIEELAAIA